MTNSMRSSIYASVTSQEDGAGGAAEAKMNTMHMSMCDVKKVKRVYCCLALQTPSLKSA